MTNGVQEYEARTPKGKAAWERAAKVIPGGVGSAIQFKPPYPLYLGDSKGSRVWDLDGNEYIDYSLCYAAMVAGHANPIIVEAIQQQAAHGTLYGMPTELAGQLAEEVIRRYPGSIDMIRFTQSGVEATQTAIRLARAATGRKTIVKIEGQYHGGTDHLLVSIGGAPADAAGPDTHPNATADSAGLLPASTEYTAVVSFNDLDMMRRAFDEHDGDRTALRLMDTTEGQQSPEAGDVTERELTEVDQDGRQVRSRGVLVAGQVPDAPQVELAAEAEEQKRGFEDQRGLQDDGSL